MGSEMCIRDREIEFWKSKGVDRVILGTLAVSNPSVVQEACRLFDGILIALDSRSIRSLLQAGKLHQAKIL